MKTADYKAAADKIRARMMVAHLHFVKDWEELIDTFEHPDTKEAARATLHLTTSYKKVQELRESHKRVNELIEASIRVAHAFVQLGVAMSNIRMPKFPSGGIISKSNESVAGRVCRR